KLAEHAPQVEKDYVAALVTRYSGDVAPDYKKLSRDFVTAMKGLSEKYPDDLDAATFYAESLMDLNPGNFGASTENPRKEPRKSCECWSPCCNAIRTMRGQIITTFTRSKLLRIRRELWRAPTGWTAWCRRRATLFTCRRTFTFIPESTAQP